MENEKHSKKALRSLINDSMQEAITRLELPAPTKKIKKLISGNAKKLASIYADKIKREEKKKKKAERFMLEAVNGDAKKKKKVKVKKISGTDPVTL